jgi:excisionase family DNA binding protein
MAQDAAVESPEWRAQERDVQEADCPVLLLRVEVAAEKLGIARTLMYRLVQSGEVESVRVGRLRRVPVACLEEYVDRLRGGRHDGGGQV